MRKKVACLAQKIQNAHQQIKKSIFVPIKRLKKEALGKFCTFHEKILQVQKAKNAHKQIKTKTILNVHKNI